MADCGGGGAGAGRRMAEVGRKGAQTMLMGGLFMVSIDGLLCQFCIGCSLSLHNNGTKLCVIGDIFGPSYSF